MDNPILFLKVNKTENMTIMQLYIMSKGQKDYPQNLLFKYVVGRRKQIPPPLYFIHSCYSVINTNFKKILLLKRIYLVVKYNLKMRFF